MKEDLHEMKANDKIKLTFPIEAGIIILIGIGMIFLNRYTESLFDKLYQAGQSAVFIKDDVEFENDQELTEQLIEYLPSTYKMIELYDEKMDLLFQIQFNNDAKDTEDIHDHPNLMEYFRSNDEGQTSLEIDNTQQNMYFKWMDNTRGEHRLLVVYSSIETVQGIWIFHLISYLIIALVFILLLSLRIRAHNDKIKAYHIMIHDELSALR